MTPDIALILGIDGIATGSIYVLVGLGPRSDFLGHARGFRAVRRHCRLLGADACLAATRPHAGHGHLVVVLGGRRLRGRCTCITGAAASRDRIVRGLIGYGVLPLIPARSPVLRRREPAELGANPLAIALVSRSRR